MKQILFLLTLVLSLNGLIGCIGTTQNLETPAPPAVQPTAGITSPSSTPTPVSAPATETAVSAPPTLTRNLPPVPTRILGPAPTKLVPPPVDTVPTPPNQTPITDATLARLVGEAKIDLSQRANVLPGEIQVTSAQPVEWRDSSLGCPMPGMMYAQVITPGYLIVLEAGGKEWMYHASTTHVMWCDK